MKVIGFLNRFEPIVRQTKQMDLKCVKTGTKRITIDNCFFSYSLKTIHYIVFPTIYILKGIDKSLYKNESKWS